MYHLNFQFFNFQVRYLRQNSRKADKVRKNCLIVFNLSFYTYLSNHSLKSADFIWQSFFSLFFEVSKISLEAQEALTNWLEADYRLYRFGFVDV